MDYKKKYLKYKKKYQNFKIFGGAESYIRANVEDDILQLEGNIINYEANMEYKNINREKYISGLDYIKSKVFKHEYLKETVFENEDDVKEKEEKKNLLELITTQFDNCKNNYWLEFVRQASFVEYLYNSTMRKDKFFIFPHTNDNINTVFSNDNIAPDYVVHRGRLRPQIFYDFRNHFLALSFKNLMMLDYDKKDYVNPESAETEIINKLENLQLHFSFLLFRTDRGIHIFIINKPYEYNSLDSVDIMRAFCADPFYTAFSYKCGYCIRTNPKEQYLDDNVAFFGSAFLKNPPVQESEHLPLISQNVLFREDKAFIEGTLDESILSVLESFTIKSDFFKEDIQLFYFKKSDIDKDGTVNAKLVFMGCKDDINNDLFFSALQQYIFIQFFKKIKRNSNPGDTDYVYLFEKGVSEQLFDILNKDNKINHLRNDIDTIFRELDDLYEVIIQ